LLRVWVFRKERKWKIKIRIGSLARLNEEINLVKI
jgi:hypothetical protein